MSAALTDSRVRVLVVDDSNFVRRSLANLLGADPRLEVIGFAADGNEALAKVRELRPDVVTMDVIMPRMNGIEAVRRLMNTDPVPVVMVSSYTRQGAAYTVEALSLGAIDCVLKPTRSVSLDLHLIAEELIAKVLLASRIRPVRYAPIGEKEETGKTDKPVPEQTETRISTPKTTASITVESAPIPAPRTSQTSFIAIGASTGGPALLRRLLASLPADYPVPVAVVQHITPSFYEELVRIFDRVCPLDVCRPVDGERPKPGKVYLAAPRSHLQVDDRRRFSLLTAEPVAGHIPSASVLLKSVASAYGIGSVGVILSGMGSDGVDGMKEIERVGGGAYVQDRLSSVVWGMPSAVLEAGVDANIVSAVELPELFRRLAEYDDALN